MSMKWNGPLWCIRCRFSYEIGFVLPVTYSMHFFHLKGTTAVPVCNSENLITLYAVNLHKELSSIQILFVTSSSSCGSWAILRFLI